MSFRTYPLRLIALCLLLALGVVFLVSFHPALAILCWVSCWLFARFAYHGQSKVRPVWIVPAALAGIFAWHGPSSHCVFLALISLLCTLNMFSRNDNP
jgi:hypothetical protein